MSPPWPLQEVDGESSCPGMLDFLTRYFYWALLYFFFFRFDDKGLSILISLVL